jgi:hypothetical protein
MFEPVFQLGATMGIIDENICGINDGINCLIICKVFEECAELSGSLLESGVLQMSKNQLLTNFVRTLQCHTDVKAPWLSFP